MSTFAHKPLWRLLWATGICGVLSYACSGWYSVLLYGLLLLGPAMEDGKSGYISDDWSVLLATSGIITSWQQGHLLESFMTAGAFLVLYGLVFLWRREAVGMGDVLLSVTASLWLTPLFGLCFLWIASMAALLFYGFCFIFYQPLATKGVRFGPFLALGGVIAYGMQEIWGISLLYAFWLYPG